MPDAWLRVSVKSPSDELAPLLAEGLLASGGNAIEERGDTLVTYIAMPIAAADGKRSASGSGDVAVLESRVRTTLRAVIAVPLSLTCEVVPEEDWLALWRAGLQPRRIGPRIIVSPTWSAVEAAPHELVIRIDPQMAFGTGEHASTRGVLRLMQRVVQPGQRLLDVGSGSAILAIAGALLGADHVVAVESDGEALPNATENVARNGVTDRVTLIGDVVDDAFLELYGFGAFDGIVANVLSSVLCPLLPAFQRALSAGGWAILSGILVEEAAVMRSAAIGAGFDIEADDVEEQWWTVLLRGA